MNLYGKVESLTRKVRCFLKKVYFLNRYRNNLKMGRNILFYRRFYLFSFGELVIGEGCFFNDDCSINCMSMIKIGDNCLFGKNVNIYDHNHIYESGRLTKEMGLSHKKVLIGNNVWCGSNVVILPGVKIGNNCVVGAGTTVYKDIPDDTLVIGKQEYIEKLIS